MCDLWSACREPMRCRIGDAHLVISGAVGGAPTKLRHISVSWLVLALVAVVALAGFLFLRAYPGNQLVWVAAADLPAFHQIAEPDIRPADKRRSDLPSKAVTNRNDLVGHYTLGPVEQGKVLTTRVGPQLASGSLQRLRPVAINAGSETTLAGQLAAGDNVDLILSSTSADETSKSVTIRDLLVLDVPPARGLVLGMTTADELGLESGYGSSHLLVVRTGTYARP